MDFFDSNDNKIQPEPLPSPIAKLPKLKSVSHQHSTELKSLLIANIITHPLGCLFLFLLTFCYMGGLVYSLLNPYELCLQFNFSDFKVIGSTIVDNWYQHSLSSDTYSFSNVYDCNCTDEVTSRRRFLPRNGNRRRLASDIMTFTTNDYYWRAISSIYLEVFFYSLNSDDILTAEHMSEAHTIEQGIKAWEGYHNRSLLYINNDYKSIVGTLYLESLTGSFLNILYPSTISTVDDISLGTTLTFYDGNGENDDLTDDEVKDEARTVYTDYPEYSFFDYTFDLKDAESEWLVNIYPFGRLNGESNLSLKKFMITYQTYFNSLKLKNVGVAYVDSKGYLLIDELYDYLFEDLQKASISGVLIFIVIYIYTRSLWLTIFGLFGIFLSFIPSFWMFVAIYGGNFNIINLVGIWVILGIGADDLFVFVASYRRAPLESIDGRLIPNSLRMAFAYREAGTAMFVTSFTTSFSFFSLMLNTINPLPQFGFFMGILVVWNFVLVMTYFPCVLQGYIWMVQIYMNCGMHLHCCDRFLAVPIAIKSNSSGIVNDILFSDGGGSPLKQHKSMKVMNRLASRRSLNIEIKENDDGPINTSDALYARDSSFRFVGVPRFNPAFSPHKSSQSFNRTSKFVKNLTEKIESTGSPRLAMSESRNSIFESAEMEFSACTNLYFVIMRKGCGIFLLISVLILTVYFTYAATTIVIPTDFGTLLPSSTNWGKVQIALDAIDVDTSTYSGLSDSGSSGSSIVVVSATYKPTSSPTGPTTPQPSLSPTLPTTASPSTSPSLPTQMPSKSPTTLNNDPSVSPTLNPTSSPTGVTVVPTLTPSNSPTVESNSPSMSPIGSPTKSPSILPTSSPTKSPSILPTSSPSELPSISPTSNPSADTVQPTVHPTGNPLTFTPTPPPTTSSPSSPPSTNNPTSTPSLFPSVPPSVQPSLNPSLSPVPPPTNNPSIPPTFNPSNVPSVIPTNNPSIPPLPYPSNPPSMQPTYNPTSVPVLPPTDAPITPSPTYSAPVASDSYYDCTNSQTLLDEVEVDATLECEVYFFIGENSTSVNASKIALVFEGAISYLTTGCTTNDDNSPYYSSTTYGTTLYNNASYDRYDVIWCYADISEWSTVLSTSYTFSLTASSVPSEDAWWLITYWIYDTNSATWSMVNNSNTESVDSSVFNFSIVSSYTAITSETALELTVSVILLFGTSYVTGYETDCDGDVSAGVLYFDDDFSFYSDAVQERLIDMCDQLDALMDSDPIMYRTTEQISCWPRLLKSYCLANVANMTSTSVLCTWPLGSNVEYVNTVVKYWLTEEPITCNSNGYCTYGGSDYNGSDFTDSVGFNKELAAMKDTWNASAATINYVAQTVTTQIQSGWGGSKTFTYYQKWEDFINDFNDESPVTLQGIQTSSKWIFMEVELAFISGFINSVLYTLILCGLVMILFTQNLALVIIVTVYILTVVIWIMGVFGAAQWPFGIIEIISIPTVVGLTIDYALHITHAYIHSPFYDRRNRSKSAVNDLGLSVMASAMTTITSMIVLYYSTIVIFSDLGWVVGATTSFGIFLALFICPPLLMYLGPQRDTCHIRWFMRWICRYDPEPCYVLGCVICDRPSNHWMDEDDGDCKLDMDENDIDLNDVVHNVDDVEGDANVVAVEHYESLEPIAADVELAVKQKSLNSSVYVYKTKSSVSQNERNVEIVEIEKKELTENKNLSLIADNELQNEESANRNIIADNKSLEEIVGVVVGDEDDRDFEAILQEQRMLYEKASSLKLVPDDDEPVVEQPVVREEINNNNNVILEESVSIDEQYMTAVHPDNEHKVNNDILDVEIVGDAKESGVSLDMYYDLDSPANVNEKIEIGGEGDDIELEESISFNPEVV